MIELFPGRRCGRVVISVLESLDGEACDNDVENDTVAGVSFGLTNSGYNVTFWCL